MFTMSCVQSKLTEALLTVLAVLLYLSIVSKNYENFLVFAIRNSLYTVARSIYKVAIFTYFCVGNISYQLRVSIILSYFAKQ